MAIVDRLEFMIDSAELRGAPPEFMRAVADVVCTDPEIRRMLDELADWCTTGQREVSPGAGRHAVHHPDRRRRRHGATLMLAHYLTLDLSPDASQEEIRRRYLELTRAHPPSRDPDRFRRIAAAYEALQDDRSRVRTAILGMASYADWELALQALVEARQGSRKTPGLQELLAAEGLSP